MPRVRNIRLKKALSKSFHTSRFKLKNNKHHNYRLTKHLINNPVINIYDNINQVEWGKLPSKFVIKSSLGAANQMVKCLHWNSKRQKYFDDLKNNWITKSQIINFYAQKKHHSGAKSVIIIEEYLQSKKQGKIPWDFKMYIAYDQLYMLRVVNRNTTGPNQVAFFKNKAKNKFNDIKLEKLPFFKWYYNHYTKLVPFKHCQLPSNINQAIKKAISVTKFLELPFTRIDAYVLNGKVYLGEITLWGGPFMYDPIRQHHIENIIKLIDQKKRKIKEYQNRVTWEEKTKLINLTPEEFKKGAL